jgi:glycerol-3-phosphate acyltransferase PlsY
MQFIARISLLRGFDSYALREMASIPLDYQVILICIFLAFLSGSIPFSVLLARYMVGADLGQIGDGNPGAANAWRAGGTRVGMLAVVLDFLKGALPVAATRYLGGVNSWELVPVALAPVLGHAFSPFLGGRGGKALAVTFGIWCGLTLYEAPLVLGLCMILFYFAQTVDAWAAILAILGLGVYLVIRQADAVLLTIWLGNFVILVWKHRHALHEPLRLNPRRIPRFGPG